MTTDRDYRKDIEERLRSKREELDREQKYPYLRNLLSDDISPDQPVFRILPFKHLVPNLIRQDHYFSHPKSWKKDDPYDSIFLRVPIELPDGTLANHSYGTDYFCQCWSTDSQSAMWRLYSQDLEGVMLISTVDKVMRSLWDPNDSEVHLKRYVGRAIYKPLSDLQDEFFFQKVFSGHMDLFVASGFGLIQTLLFKDEFFQHEKEIRFIAKAKGDGKQLGVMIPSLVPGKGYIDKVLVDPRTDDVFLQKVRKELDPFGVETERKDSRANFPQRYKFNA